jgi:DNA-binding FrmR family transcriptional regulator
MTHHKRPELTKKRLARIEGHVKGIRKMIDEEDRSYADIVQQISAVRTTVYLCN